MFHGEEGPGCLQRRTFSTSWECLRERTPLIKRISQFVGYLLISLLVGSLVTLTTVRLDNIVEEEGVAHNLKTEVENTISYFQESIPDMSPDRTIEFLEKFISSVMKAKLIAVKPSLGRDLNNKDFRYLMSFSRGKSRIDIYLKNAYVKSQADGPDAEDLVGGLFATIVVFTVLVVYAEKRRQALILQHQYENRHEELKKALEEQKALALLGRMTATLAHELKTPIATISNLTQALPARISDERFLSRFDVLMKKELNRTQQLIDNLLIYGREIALDNCQWLGLKSFAQAMSDRIGIRVERCPDVDIYTDELYMALLIENLFRNSVQAGADRVFIKAYNSEQGDNFTDLLYEDNGGGYPEECDVNELISPFTTFRPKGTGLGLYLVQKIALAHGGTVSLYRLNKGAGVRFSLPGERVRSHG
jgi:signal transduction histidine kinase